MAENYTSKDGIVRDFTEQTKTDLINIIRKHEKNRGSFWGVVSNSAADLFIGAPEIKECWDKVDEFHNNILDKNNTTVDAINRIWDDVNGIDRTYSHRFYNLRKLASAYRDNMSLIHDILNPYDPKSIERFKGVNADTFSDIETRIFETGTEYEKSKLIKWDNNGNTSYVFENIKKLMQKNKDDVTDEQYRALMNIYDEMESLDDIEKFFENSYLEPEHMDRTPLTMKYELSPVFIQMAGYYYGEVDGIVNGYTQDELDNADDSIKQKIMKQGLVKGLVENGSVLYLEGKTPKNPDGGDFLEIYNYQLSVKNQ